VSGLHGIVGAEHSNTNGADGNASWKISSISVGLGRLQRRHGIAQGANALPTQTAALILWLSTRSSEFQDIFSLQAFRAFGERKFHCLAFIESAKTITLYGPEMHKNVLFAILPCNKAKPFGVIEPLDRATYSITHSAFLGFTFYFIMSGMR
jgi:hypothetical protein